MQGHTKRGRKSKREIKEKLLEIKAEREGRRNKEPQISLRYCDSCSSLHWFSSNCDSVCTDLVMVLCSDFNFLVLFHSSHYALCLHIHCKTLNASITYLYFYHKEYVSQ